SARRLHGGYAQTKWAAEYLLREAAIRNEAAEDLLCETRVSNESCGAARPSDELAISIYRFGLLTADPGGRAPKHDWLTWFVRGLARLGVYPQLGTQPGDRADRAAPAN